MFYTAPVKALSNRRLGDFRCSLGVCLRTCFYILIFTSVLFIYFKKITSRCNFKEHRIISQNHGPKTQICTILVPFFVSIVEKCFKSLLYLPLNWLVSWCAMGCFALVKCRDDDCAVRNVKSFP